MQSHLRLTGIYPAEIHKSAVNYFLVLRLSCFDFSYFAAPPGEFDCIYRVKVMRMVLRRFQQHSMEQCQCKKTAEMGFTQCMHVGIRELTTGLRRVPRQGKCDNIVVKTFAYLYAPYSGLTWGVGVKASRLRPASIPHMSTMCKLHMW